MIYIETVESNSSRVNFSEESPHAQGHKMSRFKKN